MKRIRAITLTLIFIVALFPIPARAENILAWPNKFDVWVSGVRISAAGYDYTDANGRSFPLSITYAETPYLPIRTFSEIFNKDINFNAEDCEIFLTSKDGPAPEVKKTELQSATVSTAKVDVAFNCFNISIDGKRVISKGEDYNCAIGEIPSSLVFEGITYIPLTKVGEIMGKIVSNGNGMICVGNYLSCQGYIDFPGIPDFNAILTKRQTKNIGTVNVGPYYCATYNYTIKDGTEVPAYRQLLLENGFFLFYGQKTPHHYYRYINFQTSETVSINVSGSPAITCTSGIPPKGYYPEFPTVIDYGMRHNDAPSILTNTDIDFYNHSYLYSERYPTPGLPIAILKADGFEEISHDDLNSLNIPYRTYSSDVLAVKKDNIVVMSYITQRGSLGAGSTVHIVCIDTSIKNPFIAQN